MMLSEPSCSTPAAHPSSPADPPSVPAGVLLDCGPFQAHIRRLMAAHQAPSPLSSVEQERFLLEAELFFQALPEPIRRGVCELKSGLRRLPFLVFSGLPVEADLPPTPVNSRRPPRERALLGEWMSAAFARALGEPFGYLQENEGELFQNNAPVKRHEREQSGESSREELLFHTDASFHPLPPDFVVLYCLRPDPERTAVTSFAAVDDILAELAPAERELLFQPRFLADGVEYDYDEVGVRSNRRPRVPLLSGPPERAFLAYDRDIHRPLDAEAAEALRAFNAAMESRAVHVRLAAGDVALFDNRRSIHKRSPFHARYDGTDRWCLLTYVSGSRLDACGQKRAPGWPRLLDVPAEVP